jgi:sodium/potassium/calcium exchanger 6
MSGGGSVGGLVLQEEEDAGTGPGTFCDIEDIVGVTTDLTWENITECSLPDEDGKGKGLFDGLNKSKVCDFVKCVGECQNDDGFIDYLKLPYCALGGSIAGTMVVLTMWILILFIALGATAEDFFCPALGVISDTLNLSDNVAGVTFLAFGNGAPDIFSVVTSIVNSKGNTGAALAIGELFGAGMFVTTVVVGTVGWTVPFTVTRRPFIRDVCCYLGAAAWTAVVLHDGDIFLWEALGFIGIYVLYVLVVVIGRKIYQARKKKKADRVAAKQDKAREEEMGDIRPPSISVEEPVNSDSVYEDSGKPLDPFVQTTLENGEKILGSLAINPPDPEFNSKVPVTPRTQRRMLARSNSEIDNPQLIRLRVDTEQRVRSGSISNRPNHHPTTASLFLSRVAHTAAAEDEAERKQVQASHDALDGDGDQAARNASIYEDETPDLSQIEETYTNIEAEGIGLIPSRTEQLREKQDPWQQMANEINPFSEDFWTTAWYWKVYAVVQAPVFVALVLTIPVVDFEEEGQRWCRPLNIMHLITCPIFVCFGGGFGGSTIGEAEYPVWAAMLSVGIVAAFTVAAVTDNQAPPKYHAAYGYLGFAVSVAWIYVVANEIVNVLQTIGFLIGLSDAILGLTVLAWGNSIGDFVSNLTVAKQGYPRMAVGACYGGPALNMLLGIGIACSVKAAQEDPYVIPKSIALQVQGGFLLASLLSALIIVPASGFYIGKRFGVWLWCLYLASMGTGLYIEISGGNS